MTTIFLRGGLGNQMFQYALGLNLAKKTGTRLLLDTTFLNDRFPRRQFTYRTYDLDIFDIEPRFTALSKISSAVPIPGVWLGLDMALMTVKKNMGFQQSITEKNEAVFDPAVFHARKNSVLWGFWQSEKYFADIAHDVRAAFRFKRSLDAPGRVVSEKIKSCNAVSLHVRRGDYLLPKYQKEYGNTNMAYYERALAYVTERVPSPTIFVFSDDIAWCRANIKPSHPTIYVDDASHGYKASGHLELMSLCKNNIIANSSFSWWGAWLNANPQKIVVAPKRWHANTNANDDDIVPAGWVRM